VDFTETLHARVRGIGQMVILIISFVAVLECSNEKNDGYYSGQTIINGAL